MRIFIDASAIVAMIAREPEATTFAECLGFEGDRSTSALAIWEATRGVQSARGVEFDEAETLVADFVREAGLRIVAIGAEEGKVALTAHRLYGKGTDRARLNFGDCFAYACAKLHADAILFKGEDFIHTDLPDATLA